MDLPLSEHVRFSTFPIRVWEMAILSTVLLALAAVRVAIGKNMFSIAQRC
jgi:hypothetical protein